MRWWNVGCGRRVTIVTMVMMVLLTTMMVFCCCYDNGSYGATADEVEVEVEDDGVSSS